MTEQTIQRVETKKPVPSVSSSAETDKDIMRKIRLICSRGNNAEIKQKKDGTLTVMEVKKNIV